MPTVEQLQVQYESNIAAQAKADQAALEGASAAMKKMGDTTDQVVRRAGPSMESLVTKTDGQAAAAARGESVNRRYAASVDTVNRSIASGVISAEQGAQAIQRLTVLRDQDLQKAAAHGQAIEQKFVPAVNSGTASTNRMSFAMRDLGLQSIDMFQGIATGQPVLRTLIQQGAQVAQVNAAMGVSFKETAVGVGRFITGLAANPLVLFGAATGAVVGGIVAIGAASESSARQMLTLQTRLRATRDDYVAMAAEVTAASKAIAATTGIGTSDARAAAQAIASVPNFAGTQAQLQDLIRTSADLAAVMGKTTPEAAATLAKALKDPGAVAKQLADDSFPGMTNAMARTIERMANAGDTVGAFNRTLGVIKGATEDARNQGLTPLEQALQRLDEVFTSSGQNGRTWIDHIGKAFTDAAAQAIDAVTSTIKAIQSLQSFVGALSKDKAPGETSPYGGNVSALPFGLTVDDVKKYFSGERTIQVPMSKRLGEIAQTLPGMTSKDFANAPDSFVSASGVNEVLSAQQAIAAARNATIGAAQGVIGGSPQGQIENLKDQIKRFTELRAVLDPASDDYKKLSTAIAVNQKAMADAGKQTAATVDGFTKQIAKLKEDTAAQTELAAAYPKGERAVAQVTAQLKAQEQVISGGVLPGMAKYSAQVAEATQRNLALAEATGRAQIAQAAAANDNHLELIQAESAALGMNVDERERLLARLKAEQELKSKLVPVESELGQQYLATVDAIVEQQQALERNKEALSAITSAFTSAFDQISQAITTSFLSGTGAAVNWRNVMMSVAQQVLAQFLKLAVLNPLLNSLFNQNNATLGNVVGALGSVGAAGGVGGTTSGGGGSLFDQGSNLFTLGGLGDKLGLTNFGETLGITGNGGLLSGVNSFLSGGLFGTSAAEGTNLALSGLGTGIYGPATASSVAANTTGLFGGASIGSLLGGAGAGFGLGSLAGGFLQSSLGKTGPGPTIGAAVGTAIGTAILPGIGSIIGGLLGGAGGGLIGPGPKTPYSIQQVSVDSSGYLSAGESQTQLIDETGAAKGEIGQFNAALQALGLTIDTFNTKFGNFTKNSGGTHQFAIGAEYDPNDTGTNVIGTSLGSLLPQVNFTSADTDVAGFLAGKSFSSLDALSQAVQQFKADTEAAKQALEAQKKEIADFLSAVTGDLATFGKTTGSLNDQVAALNQQFGASITAAQQYEQSTAANDDQLQQLIKAENDLTAARDQAIAKANAAAAATVQATDIGLNLRTASAQLALGGAIDPKSLALTTFDLVTAQQQRDQLKQSLVGLFGDAYTGTVGFLEQMTLLEQTLGVERLVIAKQYDDQITASAKEAADAQVKAAEDAAAAQQRAAAGAISSIADYVRKYQVGGDSPLSQQSQFDIASRQFDAVSGAAAAGDFNSVQQFTGFADNLASSARGLYGSGAGYAQVIDRIMAGASQIVAQGPDALTASVVRSETRTQTQVLGDKIDLVATAVLSLQVALRQKADAPARAA